MKRTTHKLVPGTPEWDQHRAACFNASDAAAMLDMSKYKSRAELIRETATGIRPDVSPELQRRFDDGHRFEAAVRPLAERIIGEELFTPIMSVEIDGMRLSASFDGLTMGDDIAWEHKILNKELDSHLSKGIVPVQYHPQLEQQLLVSGAGRVLFMASNGTEESALHAWYESQPKLRDQIIAGWKQFAKDVAAYVPEESAPVPVATPIMDLPAVSVQIEGTLAVLSNLPAFGERLQSFIAGLNPAPESDQDFADAENEVKVLKRAEEELEAAEARALSQIAVVDEMRKMKAMLHKLARDTRLAREKLVKDRKDFVRAKIQQDANNAIRAHIADHNKRFGRDYMPTIASDVAGAMKGKKTMASLKDAAASEVARAKIEADRIAAIIDKNLASLHDKAMNHKFLFADAGQLVLKDPEAVAAIIDQRITAHEAEQKRKAEEAAEAAREKIRREEQEKAEREARAKVEAEERARREEEQRKAQEQLAETVSEMEAASADMTARGAKATPPTTAEVPPQAPPAAPLSKTGGMTTYAELRKPIRPSDEEIISLVAVHFGVSRAVAVGWLRTMNLADVVAQEA